jgi:hypothetical protein
LARKSETAPVTIDLALNRLFGIKVTRENLVRVTEGIRVAPKTWVSWKTPKTPCAIDTWISKRKGAGRGLRLLSREKFDGRESPFGSTFCPYYLSRQYLLRAVSTAHKALELQRELDQSKARIEELIEDTESVVSGLERLIGRAPIPHANVEGISAELAWARNFVFSQIDRRTRMIDLQDEATRTANIQSVIGRLKKVSPATIHEAKELSRLLRGELSGAREHKGRPLGVWDRAFIEELADLFLVLTGVDPAHSKTFFEFVTAANKSLGRTIDSSHQIKILRESWRTPELVEDRSSALTMDDGRIYRRGKK